MTGEDFFDDTLAHEGAVDHMYLDTRGYVTCGIGQLLKTADDAAQLAWTLDGREATEAEVRRDWVSVADMKADDATMKRRAAGFYRGRTRCRMSDDEVRRVCVARIDDEFIPGLRGIVEFDDLPAPAQAALVDMTYNLGLGGLRKFKNFLGAVRSQNWAVAAAQCHRSTCRETRNEWTERQLLSCA